MANRSLTDFKHESDSVSLKMLDGKPFTIAAVVDSDYDGNKGIKLTTVESFQIDGKSLNKFHSTRTAIVNKLSEPSLRKALQQGDTIGPVKAVETPAKKGGKPYFDLVPA